MRLLDIFRLASQDLWQRKLRTCLNLLGIVIGSIMLLLTAAGASGSRIALRQLFDSSELVRQIWVTPMYYYASDPPDEEIVVDTGLSPERESRIRQAMINQWKADHREAGNYSISLESARALEQLPRVARVIPDTRLPGTIQLEGSPSKFVGNLTGIDVQASKYAALLVAGETLADVESDEVLVSEWLAYRMGYGSVKDLEQLVGKQIILQYSTGADELNWMYSMLSEQYSLSASDLAEQASFATAFQQLLNDLEQTSLSDDQKQLLRGLTQKVTSSEAGPGQQLKTRTFTVRGIVRADDASGSPASMFKMWFHRSQGDVFVHHRLANKMQLEDPKKQQFSHALVVVESASDLKRVSNAIKDLKLETASAEWLWDNVQGQIDSVTRIVYGLAAAVLLTSALGISNTLLISVLHRTPEFGILKSVGARDRDLLLLMLSEGVLLGVLGATLAIGFGIVLATAGHQILVNYIASRSGEQVSGQLFNFSASSIIFVYLAATSICAFASILPAWRAARLDPIVAMRRT